MQRLTFWCVFLASLLLVSGGKAQRSSDFDKPMWTMEFIRVNHGMSGLALGYLDDNWIRVVQEAKRQGAVLSYHRFVEQGSSGSDTNIVLLTEFKNQSAYYMRDMLFASIRKRLPDNSAGIVRPQKPEDLYQTVSTGTFLDYPDANEVQPRLLSKN